MRSSLFASLLLGLVAGCTGPVPIAIDGRFEDWSGVPSHRDPAGDTHDTDHKRRTDRPGPVDHPDVDLLEYKATSDGSALYFYFRARGRIGRSSSAAAGGSPGRYYAIVAIDVDDDQRTGYWLHEGGFYPTSRGYDLNAELEFYDGQLNTGHYNFHGARTAAEKRRAFADQSGGKYRPGHDGPYPAGIVRLQPGTYAHYSQWVYHADGTLTFVLDRGPVVPGIIEGRLSPDGRQLEMRVPFRGFLQHPDGRPIVGPGQSLRLSFSLEASGELAPGRRWASDTAKPIRLVTRAR